MSGAGWSMRVWESDGAAELQVFSFAGVRPGADRAAAGSGLSFRGHRAIGDGKAVVPEGVVDARTVFNEYN